MQHVKNPSRMHEIKKALKPIFSWRVTVDEFIKLIRKYDFIEVSFEKNVAKNDEALVYVRNKKDALDFFAIMKTNRFVDELKSKLK